MEGGKICDRRRERGGRGEEGEDCSGEGEEDDVDDGDESEEEKKSYERCVKWKEMGEGGTVEGEGREGIVSREREKMTPSE